MLGRVEQVALAGIAEVIAPDGTWAAPETLMVSLSVACLPQPHPQDSTLELILPDGSPAPPHGDLSRVFEAVAGGGAA